MSDPARSAKESVIRIYEVLYEQQKALRRLDLAMISLLETVKELNVQADDVYAKHFQAEGLSLLMQQHDAALKDVSDIIGKLKASLPN